MKNFVHHERKVSLGMFFRLPDKHSDLGWSNMHLSKTYIMSRATPAIYSGQYIRQRF